VPPPRRPARPGWRRGRDGFYEWKKLKGRKQPYYIRLQDGGPFAVAGLWEHWDRGSDPIDSCTILTTDANELVGSIHDRMPVILDPGDYGLWLDPEVQDAKGHYWLTATRPALLAENVACLDYSVAKGGFLCAYRSEGERKLTDGKFVWVPAAR
jgi:putative SOS response-associated peptidase YedK